jgi:uncharacterized protein YuzE
VEAIKILEKTSELTWDYDNDADLLYISVGKPRPGVGVDIGDGLIVRYDESNREVIGLTVIGVKDRLMNSIAASK